MDIYLVYAMAFHAFMKRAYSCVHKYRFRISATHKSWPWILPKSVVWYGTYSIEILVVKEQCARKVL